MQAKLKNLLQSLKKIQKHVTVTKATKQVKGLLTAEETDFDHSPSAAHLSAEVEARAEVKEANAADVLNQATMVSISVKALVTDRTFGSTEWFGRTSTAWFDPNDRFFFWRT
jgi:hypothetical protein